MHLVLIVLCGMVLAGHRYLAAPTGNELFLVALTAVMVVVLCSLGVEGLRRKLQLKPTVMDKAGFAMLAEGKTQGVFQLESAGITGVCVNMKPTSIEDMTMRNGEDIRKHIQDNIRSAEYSFLLISDNYKASEICVNEMGAVWAYDANVKIFLLPNADFSSIGWLCDTRKADKLTDSVALDRLYNEMIEYCSLPGNFLHWSGQREMFLGRMDRICE